MQVHFTFSAELINFMDGYRIHLKKYPKQIYVPQNYANSKLQLLDAQI